MLWYLILISKGVTGQNFCVEKGNHKGTLQNYPLHRAALYGGFSLL